MPSFLRLIALTTTISSALATDFTDKPWIFNGDDGNRAEAFITTEFTLATVSKTTDWPAQNLPKWCIDQANEYNLPLYNVEAKDVYFDDCEEPWAICRYSNATESWDTIQTRFGRVPVGMRQFLANVLILPEGLAKTVSAYTNSQKLSQTYGAGYFKTGVMLHEFSHILDLIALQAPLGIPAGTPYSSTKYFLDAFNNDSAVPTDYSRTTLQELFADTGRWGTFGKMHAGGLGDFHSNWTMAGHLFTDYLDRLDDIIWPSGGRCTGRVASSESVYFGISAVTKLRSDEAVESSATFKSGVKKIIPPESVVGQTEFVYQGHAPNEFEG
ncbi:hypothetical protein BX600DRAFT_504484 [Xylariales sp. PMI_506]|nr:hypothetical protein BX600DRAFT_504484 [Xylariales sp. PMI_506]